MIVIQTHGELGLKYILTDSQVRVILFCEREMAVRFSQTFLCFWVGIACGLALEIQMKISIFFNSK